MGVIDYTKRSKRLINLGEVRRVEPAKIIDSHVSYDGLGKGLAQFGNSLVGIYAGLRKQKEDRELAEDAIEIRRLWRQRMTNEENGYMLRRGAAAEGIEEEAAPAFEEDVQTVAGERSDDHMEKLRIMLGNHLTDLMSTVRIHEFGEVRKAAVASADGLVKEDATDWAAGVQTDGGFMNALINLRHALDLHDEMPPAAKREAERKWGEDRFGDIVRSKLLSCDSPEAFDGLKETVEKNPAKLLENMPEFAKHLSSNAGGKPVSDDLRDRMKSEVLKAKRNWIVERDFERRLATEELKDGLVKRELEMMDADLPREKWVDFYEELAKDPKLRELAPEMARGYMETARKMKGAVTKGETSDDADSLARRLTVLNFCEVDGRYDERQIAAEQAAIWRDFKAALLSGRLSEQFSRTFLGRLKTKMGEDERRAMREFYSSFGYHGDIDSDGEIPSSDRKAMKAVTFRAPVDETVPLTRDIEKGRKISGAQLFELGDVFLRELRALGPDVSRTEAVRTLIGDIKTRKMASDFAKNRDELAMGILNIQRNLRAEGINDERGNAGGGSGTGGGSNGGGGAGDGKPGSRRRDADGKKPEG